MALDPATTAAAAKLIAPLLKGGTNVKIGGTDLANVRNAGQLIAVKGQLEKVVKAANNRFIKKAYSNSIKEIDKRINELQAQQAVQRTSLPNVRPVITSSPAGRAIRPTSTSRPTDTPVSRSGQPRGSLANLASSQIRPTRFMPSPVSPASLTENQAANAVADPGVTGIALNDMSVPFYMRPLFWMVSAVGAIVTILIVRPRKRRRRRR